MEDGALLCLECGKWITWDEVSMPERGLCTCVAGGPRFGARNRTNPVEIQSRYDDVRARLEGMPIDRVTVGVLVMLAFELAQEVTPEEDAVSFARRVQLIVGAL